MTVAAGEFFFHMRLGALQVATDAMARDLGQARRRAVERERALALIKWSDAMIEELELLNLKDVATVSPHVQARLMLFFAALPFGHVPALPPSPWSPTELLDLLFDVQGYLFELKNDELPAPRSEARAS